jgi:hypothetical protein
MGRWKSHLFYKYKVIKLLLKVNKMYDSKRLLELAGLQPLAEGKKEIITEALKKRKMKFDKDGIREDFPNGASVDYKADPEEVLEEVSKQLKGFGLQVVLIDNGDGDDEYLWVIEKK